MSAWFKSIGAVSSRRPTAGVRRTGTGGGWRPAILAGFCWVGAVWLFVWANPRLLASWHGFLHTGIAYRFPSGTFTPENPYFAGLPIAYYWFYQALGRTGAAIAGTDLLHSFQWIGLASLALLVVSGVRLGQRSYGSTAAGLMIGYLALLGMNPLGPAIASAKHLLRQAPILEHATPDAGGDIFVSDAQADNRMARPLLGALHIATDWQSGQDIVWFVDVSSRGPAIALLMVVAALVLRRGSNAVAAPALAGVGALTAALNPIIGLSTGGCLIGAALLSHAWRLSWGAPGAAGADELIRSAGFFAGVLAAWPIYSHLFAFEGAAELSDLTGTLFKSAAVAAGFVILLPLAIWGCWQSPPDARRGLTTLTLAGLLLLLPVPFVSLYEINEHNFVNAASCILAVPAAAWVARGKRPARSIVRALLLSVVFLPTTIGTVVAFSGRPELPLHTDGSTLRRRPLDGPLDRFYRWAAASTPPSTVLLTNPDDTVKMSGNVSEIPAFTRRAIFVDKVTYMTERYGDLGVRTSIARLATAGETLPPEHRAYLANLGRPLYLVTFHADAETVMAKLRDAYGAPVFHREFVAAFPVPSNVASVTRDRSSSAR